MVAARPLLDGGGSEAPRPGNSAGDERPWLAGGGPKMPSSGGGAGGARPLLGDGGTLPRRGGGSGGAAWPLLAGGGPWPGKRSDGAHGNARGDACAAAIACASAFTASSAARGSHRMRRLTSLADSRISSVEPQSCRGVGRRMGTTPARGSAGAAPPVQPGKPRTAGSAPLAQQEPTLLNNADLGSVQALHRQRHLARRAQLDECDVATAVSIQKSGAQHCRRRGGAEQEELARLCKRGQLCSRARRWALQRGAAGQMVRTGVHRCTSAAAAAARDTWWRTAAAAHSLQARPASLLTKAALRQPVPAQPPSFQRLFTLGAANRQEPSSKSLNPPPFAFQAPLPLNVPAPPHL